MHSASSWTRSVAASAASVLIALTAAAADGPADEQVLRSSEGFGRNISSRGGATTQELEEERIKPEDRITKPRALAPVASTGVADQWIYDADVELFDDFDNDGYYRYISVRVDADTYLAHSWVYAMVFLSYDGETWEHLYTTEDFLIEGSTSYDEYFVETELVTGYPTGLYDVLVELYDADLGVFVDDFGPYESSALSLLPLEGADFDVPPIVVSISHGHGGGGAAGLPLLALLGGAALLRRFRGRSALTGFAEGL
jgi:hypothetical protein